MKCRNPNGSSICLCPQHDGLLRSTLAAKFINGWLQPGLTKAANALAADPLADQERLRRMLNTLEDEASGAYEMWRQTC